MKNLEQLLNLYAIAYHNEKYFIKVFWDELSRKLFTDDEYNSLSEYLIASVGYLKMSDEEKLRFCVDNLLSPLALAREVFCEAALKNALELGAKQCVFINSGYSLSSIHNSFYLKQAEVFEVDTEQILADKILRVENAGQKFTSNINFINADFTVDNLSKKLLEDKNYDNEKITFVSIFGVTQKLRKADFSSLLSEFKKFIAWGSTVVFDYNSSYSYIELQKILSLHGFKIYEHIDFEQMTKQFFSCHNYANPENIMKAQKGVNYVLSVFQP